MTDRKDDETWIKVLAVLFILALLALGLWFELILRPAAWARAFHEGR